MLPQHKRKPSLPSQTETKMSYARPVADVEREGAYTSVPPWKCSRAAWDLNVGASGRNLSSDFTITTNDSAWGYKIFLS